MGIPVDDGRDLSEGARGTKLLDMFAAYEVIRGHTEPARECRQAVDIRLTALGQAGERGGTDARLRCHVLPCEAPRTPLGIQCRM